MTRPVIRELTASDLDSAFALSSTAGWNQRLEDWRMLVGLAPRGSFTAIVDGALVGTAIGIDYGAFGWIAMMLVDPAYRGKGLGAALLQAAMDAVPSNLPIRLDATPLGRPLYERYGFVEETSLTRLVARSSPALLMSGSAVQRAAGVDLPAVFREDAGIFGADRRAVLEWSLGDAPYGRIVRDDLGPAGYCFGRRGRLFDQIGPVVAREEGQARKLVSSAIVDVPGRPVVIDAYDEHQSFSQWLHSLGFRAERPLFRMSRGAYTRPGRAALREFAIFGPDFG